MATITDIDDLKTAADTENGFECFISVAGGLGRSSKHIWYDHLDDSWFVRHDVDDSETGYTSTDGFISGEPNIMQAIRYGVLIPYN